MSPIEIKVVYHLVKRLGLDGFSRAAYHVIEKALQEELLKVEPPECTRLEHVCIKVFKQGRIDTVELEVSAQINCGQNVKKEEVTFASTRQFQFLTLKDAAPTVETVRPQIRELLIELVVSAQQYFGQQAHATSQALEGYKAA